jgi:tetratricopeptide (TPR) repeat protein
MIADALRLNPDADGAEVVARAVLPRVGGNPLAIRLAVGMWEQGVEWDALDRVIDVRLFGSLDWREQQAWRALALFPHTASADELRTLWQIEENVLRRLVRLGVLEGDRQAYGLVGAAREYARSLPPEPFLHLLEQILPPDGFDVIEYALATGFPERRIAQRAAWISAYWREGLRRGHWAVWRAILEAHFAETEAVPQDLRIAYGMCLRRLSEWERAEQVFFNVVADCGRSGQFAEQSQALAEWSALSRYQGKYERAQALVDQAKRYALRAHDAALIDSLALQEAQILLQQGRASEAHKLVSTQASTSALALQSEARLMLGQYDSCRALAYRALEADRGDQATEASLYTIIGRSFQAQGDWEGAQHALSEAVVLLERLDDAFALARAQTNLAAVLIPLGHYEDARTLLNRAEAVQALLGDRVGLGTTQHNRAILAGHIAR